MMTEEEDRRNQVFPDETERQDLQYFRSLQMTLSNTPRRFLSRESAGTPHVEEPFPIRKQVASGRCWIFAYINNLQLFLHKKHTHLELSRDWHFVTHLYSQVRLVLRHGFSIDFNGTTYHPYGFGDGNGIRQDSFFPQFVALVEEFGVLPYELMPNDPVAMNAHRVIDHLNALTVSLRASIEAGECSVLEGENLVIDLLEAYFGINLATQRVSGRTPLEYARELGVLSYLRSQVVLNLSNYQDEAEESHSVQYPSGGLVYSQSIERIIAGSSEPPRALSISPSIFSRVIHELVNHHVVFSYSFAVHWFKAEDRNYTNARSPPFSSEFYSPNGTHTLAGRERGLRAIGEGLFLVSHKATYYPAQERTSRFNILDSQTNEVRYASTHDIQADIHSIIVPREFLLEHFSFIVRNITGVQRLNAAQESMQGYN